MSKLEHRLNRLRLRTFAAMHVMSNGCVLRARPPRGERLVALSFDDGPSDANTHRILDLLRQHDARATFFVVGDQVGGRERLVRQAVVEGHEIANHTFSHRHPLSLTDEELSAELERASEAIGAAASVVPRIARPPFGKDSRRFAEVAAGLGLSTALWSVDSGDTYGYSGSTVARFVSSARNGDIVLLHDGGDLRPSTLDATQRAVTALSGKGFRLVTISELLACARETSEVGSASEAR